jgi:hypothetical protein
MLRSLWGLLLRVGPDTASSAGAWQLLWRKINQQLVRDVTVCAACWTRWQHILVYWRRGDEHLTSTISLLSLTTST